MPKSVTYLNHTPIFEWHVVWCGSKNGYKKHMCLKAIRLHAQNMRAIMNSIAKLIGGGTYMTNF
jgi:hypothetical protein